MTSPGIIRVEDAVNQALHVLRERGDQALAEELSAAYSVFAGSPISRVRIPSMQHAPLLMTEIQSDESMDIASNNAASTLHMRISIAIGMVNPKTEPEPDPGVPVDRDGCTYRVDGDNVLHYEVRNNDNVVIHGLDIRVAPLDEGGPPLVAKPGLRTGRFPRPNDDEREFAWHEARKAVDVAWELGLWDGRDL